jgi:hypothetical protein
MNKDITTGWFNEPISDEAAYTLYKFAERVLFEIEAYYLCQIRRHAKTQERSKNTQEPSCFYFDDDIDF